MAEDYIGTFRRLEKECLSNMRKARDIFLENGEVHSKLECEYLQRAANIRSELAKMAPERERENQLKKLGELNRSIVSIQEMLNISTKRSAPTEEKKSAPPAPRKAAEDSDGPSDEEVASWFKPQPRHSFEDVSGMEGLKERMKECVMDTQLEELYSFLGIKQLHSFFFYGPPGCGKTFIVEAFAHELMEMEQNGEKYSFISVVGSDILSKYVGEAEANVTRLFQEALDHSPCILFIDEIDGVCRERSQPEIPVHASSLTTAFLTGYNKLKSEDNKKVIFIGATNFPDQVDSAMMDRVQVVSVPLPDHTARASVFKKKLSAIVPEDETIYDRMADATESYSFRDIERLEGKIKAICVKDVMRFGGNDKTRAMQALTSGEYRLTWDLFMTAKRACPPSPKDRILDRQAKWEKAYSLDDGEAQEETPGDEPGGELC